MFLEFDLERGAAKIEKEQQKRRDEARKKKEREERLKKEKAERDVALAALKVLEEEKRQAALAAREIMELKESALTGGINFQKMFSSGRIFIIESEIDDDKIILSEDCLQELNAQDAFRLGPMTFLISNLSGSVKQVLQNYCVPSLLNNRCYFNFKFTHAGVREFSGAPGFIGISKKVLTCLTGSDDVTALTSISVKYVRLPKCTYVKLRPKLNIFFEVGPVKMCLEENLSKHSTLTVGDTLTVWYRGKSYVLQVSEMKPQPSEDESWQGCSLVDADVEVDLDVSEELSSSTAAAAATATTTTISSSKVETAASRSGYRTAIATPMETVPSSRSEPLQSVLGAVELSPEPSAEQESSVLLKIKLPDNKTVIRRFLLEDALRKLVQFVAVSSTLPLTTVEQLASLQISLRSSFPPKNIRFVTPSLQQPQEGGQTDGGGLQNLLDQTLQQVGIRAPQESIVVMVH